MKYHEFEKKHVSRKLKKPSYRTKNLSLLTTFFFIIALGLCAYLPAGINGKLGTEENKSFTISRALANANKPSFVAVLFISYFFLVYLLIVRGPAYLFVRRIILLTVSFLLLVSLLWVTTSYNVNLHYILASIIFTFIYGL